MEHEQGQPPSPLPGWAAPAGTPPPTPQFAPGYGSSHPGWVPPPRAAKPGVVALRPLGLSDILDGAVSYVRRDPRTVLGISAALSLVLVALTYLLQISTLSSLSRLSDPLSSSGSSDDFSSSFSGSDVSFSLATPLAYVLSAGVELLATGLLTVVVGQAVLGRRTAIGQAWRTLRPRLWALLGVAALTALILLGVAALGIGAAVGIGVLLYQANDVLGIVIGLLLGLGVLALVVWLYVRLLLAPVAVVLERVGPVTGLRRSTRLVKGSWWRVFGIYLLARILISIVAGLLSVPFTVMATITLLTQPAGSLPWWYFAVLGIGTFVSAMVTMPFVAGVVALQYVDLRIRREALDIELARAASTG